MTTSTLIATLAAGLFAGASTYVSVAEHPARIECGPAVGIKQFGPSARRAAVLQGGLAMIGLVAAAVAWFQGLGVGWLVGGSLLGAVVPFTFLVIIPINKRLLDSRLDPGSPGAARMLVRWGQLHAIRTIVGVAAFVAFAVLSVRS